MTTHEQAQRFKALADPTRLALLEIISRGQGTLNVIALQFTLNAQLGKHLSQPTISYHLSILRYSGMIESREDGLEAFYRLRSNALTGAMDAIRAIVRQEVAV